MRLLFPIGKFLKEHSAAASQKLASCLSSQQGEHQGCVAVSDLVAFFINFLESIVYLDNIMLS